MVKKINKQQKTLDVFNNEYKVLEKIDDIIVSKSENVLSRDFHYLRDEYEKLLKTAAKMTIISDGYYKKLHEANEKIEKQNLDLQEAISKINILSGLVPICAGCKKIRDDKGFWNQLEEYISNYSNAEFTHGLCPECAKIIYGDYVNENEDLNNE